MYRFTTLLTVMVTLTGCATMNESECQFADWEDIGRRDAQSGHVRQYFSEHASACSEFGINADQAAYQRGWDQGIELFCTPENGWQRGINGQGYNNSCPQISAAAFRQAYTLGRDLHAARQNVSSLESRLNEVRKKLAKDDLEDEKYDELRKDRKRLKYELYEAELDEDAAESAARRHGFTTY
jgi:hypothetical protein